MKPTTFSLLYLILCVPVLHAEDWPRFRGPRGDGTSAESTLPVKWGPKENVAWKVELPGPGSSSPIVLGQRVFVTCFSGKKADEIVRHVFCFERTGGKQLWKNSYPAPQPENDYTGHLLQHGFKVNGDIASVRPHIHAVAFDGNDGGELVEVLCVLLD